MPCPYPQNERNRQKNDAFFLPLSRVVVQVRRGRGGPGGEGSGQPGA
jgi:hypothetical protein